MKKRNSFVCNKRIKTQLTILTYGQNYPSLVMQSIVLSKYKLCIFTVT